ncbi:MAG: hypothetical protein WKF84_07360 [Pyrinomonadaceae bacterium]
MHWLIARCAARSTRAFVAARRRLLSVSVGTGASLGWKNSTEVLTAFAGTAEFGGSFFGAQAGAGTPQKMAEGYAYEVEMASQSTGEKQVWRERRLWCAR